MAAKTKKAKAPAEFTLTPDQKYHQKMQKATVAEIDRRLVPARPTLRHVYEFPSGKDGSGKPTGEPDWQRVLLQIEAAAGEHGHILPSRGWEWHLNVGFAATNCVKCGLGVVVDGRRDLEARGTLHVKPCEYRDYLDVQGAAAESGIPLCLLRQWMREGEDIWSEMPRGIRSTRRFLHADEAALLRARYVVVPGDYEMQGEERVYIRGSVELLSREDGERRKGEWLAALHLADGYARYCRASADDAPRSVNPAETPLDAWNDDPTLCTECGAEWARREALKREGQP